MGAAHEPDPMVDGFRGPIAGRALTCGVILGVFDALHEEGAAPAELAERLGLDPQGTETLTSALLALGYLEYADGRLTNAAVTERLLVRASPESVATFFGEQGDLHWEVLTMLPGAVRDGRRYAMHEEGRDPERWRAYMRGLFEISRQEHEANAAMVPVEQPRRLVDVAGGHGAFSMAMCRRHPGLRATIVDLPPAVQAGSEIVEQEGFADRVSFVEGDVFEVGFEEGIDVVSVFNLVHHLPQERDRELVEMARAALRDGGYLVVGDTERPAPGEQSHGAFSGLLFYAWSHGRNFSRDEIAGWLADAGFEDLRVYRNERSPWRIVVVGRA